MIVFISGCAGFGVKSTPPGAEVFFNNQSTGKLTPAKFYLRDMPCGDYDITLKKDGYKTATNIRKIRIEVSGISIFMSVLNAPIGPIMEMFGGQWKDVYANREDGSFKGRPFRIKYQLEPIKDESKSIEHEPGIADPAYKNIKGICLMNGKIIEGQILSIKNMVLKIQTKDGQILSYSFEKDIKQLITK
ncbi:MAG: PEGA domain-containing protein [Pseudomonadota bacterium]